MESALFGLVLDSSVLVAAERKNLTTSRAIKRVREATGGVPSENINLHTIMPDPRGNKIIIGATPEN